MTMHDMLIFTHALSGSVSFLVGSVLIAPPVKYDSSHAMFRLYWYSLLVMIGTLVVVVPLDFPGLAVSEKASFSGLSLLALYMGYRALGALRAGRAKPSQWKLKFVDDIGFTLISLFDGFIIVLALDLRFPIWAVGALAAFGIAAGIMTINAVKHKIKTQPNQAVS